jgi:mannose-6-phosphate isomerase-like protein (cupin superfamily)
MAPDSVPGRSHRPWGWYETLAQDLPTGSLAGQGGYLVKRLWVNPHNRISLQRHSHRCEHWLVVQGSGRFESDGQDLEAAVGTSLFVPQGAMHRASAGPDGLLIIEVQRGLELREDDIERFEDDYGRVLS